METTASDRRWHPTTTEARSEGRPVFMVNPPIIIAFNDDMAEELAAYLRKTAMSNPVPPSVYAFMRQLENDLAHAKN